MTKITIKKPDQRWLFGGLGFHNSEASMTGAMSEDFKNQVVLKCFREVSPTYSRIFSGYADWSKEDMDRFADYYDLTFRKANTTLYLVPGRMPYRDKDFNMEEYAEKVACNLEYLIKERKCTKIRHYCLTNELAIGKDRTELTYNFPLFKEMNEVLYSAFKRHKLSVGLLSMDSSGFEDPWPAIDWAVANMADTSECFCHHIYPWNINPGDNTYYNKLKWMLDLMVKRSFSKEKRFVLGEFGFKKSGRVHGAMFDDRASYVNFPEIEGESALQYPEMCTAAITCGVFSACAWTFIDYPDPMICEDGDTDEEKGLFDTARFSGHGLTTRYNKNGMIRWCDEEKDYRAYAPYYTMGLMAKYFRKGSRVLVPEFKDQDLRVCAVTNPDGSYSVCVVNYSEEQKEIEFTNEHKCQKALRKYSYDSKNPPYNDFNDLQDYDELITVKDNAFVATVQAKGMILLTTDYEDRVPTEIQGVKVQNDKLMWDACADQEHTYYRVYKNGKQIASTVAEHLTITDKNADYTVCSVDKYGNCLKK